MGIELLQAAAHLVETLIQLGKFSEIVYRYLYAKFAIMNGLYAGLQVV